MAMHRLVESHTFSPEDVANLIGAYEQVCRSLNLVEDRYAAANELVATIVIEIAQTGVRDTDRLAALVIERVNPQKHGA